MTTAILMDERALQKRIFVVYAQMGERAKPKYWKSGPLRGKMRIPGIPELPFTRVQLWQHALKLVGANVAKCPYCEAIGRPVNLITLANCVFDHKVPIDRGGTWDLENLVPVCSDCNNLKGRLSYELFVALMSEIERWPDQRDRTNLYSCLRTHGVTMRLRFLGKEKKPQPAEPEAPTTMDLALRDNW